MPKKKSARDIPLPDIQEGVEIMSASSILNVNADPSGVEQRHEIAVAIAPTLAIFYRTNYGHSVKDSARDCAQWMNTFLDILMKGETMPDG